MEGIDKILEPLGELPVLVRTLQVFQSCDLVHEVIVVTREDLIVPVSQLCRDFMLDKVTKVMVGGAERVLSVRIGVQEARRDAALIAIHDGARPLLSREVLEEVLKRLRLPGRRRRPFPWWIPSSGQSGALWWRRWTAPACGQSRRPRSLRRP